jgi:hypothetical protein
MNTLRVVHDAGNWAARCAQVREPQGKQKTATTQNQVFPQRIEALMEYAKKAIHTKSLRLAGAPLKTTVTL